MQTVHWTWLGEPVQIQGRYEPVALGKINALNNFCIGIQSNWSGCTSCHAGFGWEDANFDFSQASAVDCLACQTCHIPAGAVKDPTKMYWDWSTAGQDLEEDVHTYLKIKGSFIYENNFTPEYYWHSGIRDRYLFGDEIDPNQVTILNPPAGDISDPTAKIFPFKVHRARQPYDLSPFTPSGAELSFVSDTNTIFAGDLITAEDGSIYFQPQVENQGLYVLGHDSRAWFRLRLRRSHAA